MTSRVALLTGATGAIGEAIAEGVAREGDHEVVLACRDVGRGEAAAKRIRSASAQEAVRVEEADLSRPRSLDALRERWSGPLHLLVNCAAVAPRRRTESEEGVELQLAVNVLGYLRMIDRFADALADQPGARVVNVASYWAGDLALDDLEFRRRSYDNDTAYRQSKQANRMLTVVDAERLAARGIAVNCGHPGDVNSQLSRDLGFGGHESPAQGAATPLMLALEPVGHEVTAKYFAGRAERACPFAADRDAVAALAEACRAYG